ncbi:MAG: hypothetical protein JWP89_5636 [Schlesneria sp.]|nr:hypothetical protein [Schlesneria sp.]
MCALLCVCALTVIVAIQVPVPSAEEPLFKNEPILETCETRIHIAKDGAWTVQQEATFHFEYLDTDDEMALANEFADKQWPKNLDRSQRLLTGPHRDKPWARRWKVKVTGKKSKDMGLLVHLLQVETRLPDCTFSWNKKVLELNGVKAKRRTGDSTGSVIGDIVVGMVIQSMLQQMEADVEQFLIELAVKASSPSIVDLVDGWNHARVVFPFLWVLIQEMQTSRRFIITTDGTISSTAPAIVDPKGKTLTIDPTLLEGGEYPEWWIRIEGLKSR